ncbi:MAG: hypothetical protein M1503_06610 [Thaumarchaeota archaeon]|nr:hypothetical protein [Nitrososphaerota archaeon]
MKFEPPTAPIKITIETPLNPSEDPEKVSKAIRNLTEGAATDLTITKEKNRLIAETEDPTALSNIYQKIRARLSLGVARKHLRRNASKKSTSLCFNKQAAYVKTLNICEESESPLGALKVTIRSRDLDKIIDWLAPQQLE